jgi:hypothetical protein
VVTFLVVWTLAVATAIVLVLAAYLIAIAYYLYRAGGGPTSRLAQLAGGLVAVRQNAAPLEQKMAAVARALVALRGELQAVDEYLAEAAQTLRR